MMNDIFCLVLHLPGVPPGYPESVTDRESDNTYALTTHDFTFFID